MPRGQTTKPCTNWNSESESLLLSALKDVLKDGAPSENNFKPQVYSQISKQLSQAGFSVDSEQVKSRSTRFKAMFKVVDYLQNASGFGWNDTTKTVTASEDVWERVLYNQDGSRAAKYKDYLHWRTNPFPQYNNIAKIIGNNLAIGDNAFSSVQGTLIEENKPEAERGSPGNEGDGPEDVEQEVDEEENEESQESSQTTVTPSQPSTRARSVKQRMQTPPASPPPKRRWSTMSAHLGTLAEAVGTLVTGLISPKTTPSKGEKRQKEAWHTVKAEDGLSPLSLSKACKVFHQLENVEEYRSFDNTDPTDMEARLFWLASEMENLSK